MHTEPTNTEPTNTEPTNTEPTNTEPTNTEPTMHTAICDLLGCELPVFAFSHCRDVVAAVTRAGGFGVLGASTYSPEQLETELAWVDEHTGGRPYGVDVLIPSSYDERAELAAAGPEALHALVPDGHRAFQDAVLAAAGVPELSAEERDRVRRELAGGRGAMTAAGARRLVAVALSHPRVTLLVSALGAPPPDVVEQARARGVVLGAMCGKARHAQRQIAAGVQVVVAQGTEAGGHTGDIATLVLVPEVVDVAGDRAHVLAEGGITRGSQVAAALVMGAAGVWCGTLWLGTRESELDDFERSVLYATPTEGTVRSPVRTGKPVRMVHGALVDAWTRPDAPRHLPTPLQGILWGEAHHRIVKARRADLYCAPAGQSVGALTGETSVADVMYRLQVEYADAVERLVGP